MASKKIITSVVAVATAAVLATGGTFAWQSISQSAVNQSSDVVNPGGRLHNDLGYTSYSETNSDVYVENFADDDIFARVRLGEYFEVVMNKGVEGIEREETLIGEKTEAGEGEYDYTYATYTFKDENKNEDGTFGGAIVDDTPYMKLAVGTSEDETLYYMPTFNKNKDSLLADLNGTYAGELGEILERNADQYVPGEEITAGKTKQGYAIYDNDINNIDELGLGDIADIIENGEASDDYNEDYIAVTQETHTAAEVGTTRGLISIEDWLALEEDTDSYWVYDTDGWVYWSSPIKAESSTGLLLNNYTLTEVMDETWYYAINVEAQFITANDSGKANGTGFYSTDDGPAPSPEAEQLLAKIGVDSEAEAEATVHTVSLRTYDEISADGYDIGIMKINDGMKFTVTGEDELSSDNLTVKKSTDSRSYKTLTLDEDYTFEDGVLKFISDEVAAGTLVEVSYRGDSGTTQGYIAVDGKTKLTVIQGDNISDDGMWQQIIVADVGDEFLLVDADGNTIDGNDKPAFSIQLDAMNTRDEVSEYEFANGKLKITDDKYAGDLLYITVQWYIDDDMTRPEFYGFGAIVLNKASDGGGI